VGVEAYCGWHGQGKTMCAVESVIRLSLASKSEFWTNAGVVGARRFETWGELMGLIERGVQTGEPIEILVDEIGIFAPARFWQKMDPRVHEFLQQRRKVAGPGVNLHYTVPIFSDADKSLRGVTQLVHLTRRWGGSEYSHQAGKRPPWCFSVNTYRPHQLDDTGGRSKKKQKPLKRRLVHFSPDLAGLFETKTLFDLSKSMEGQLADRPNYREADTHAPPAAPPTVVVLNQKGKK
jgi:hypothetical protein